MKRYPSVDYLRGLAIFLMVYLHTFMRWFDRDTFIDQVGAGTAPLALVILLVLSLFFGSWCGFFLMVSEVFLLDSVLRGDLLLLLKVAAQDLQQNLFLLFGLTINFSPQFRQFLVSLNLSFRFLFLDIIFCLHF